MTHTNEDIEALEVLMQQAVTIKQYALNNNQEPVYPIAFKKETARLKFTLGIMSAPMNNELGLSAGSCETWTLKYSGSEDYRVSQQHGDGIRWDVATKAHAIKLHFEKGIPIRELAEEFGVSQPAVSSWKNKYKDCYKDYIHAIEGTIVIGKPDKRIIGMANAKRIQLIQAETAQITKKAILATQSLEHDLKPIDKAATALQEINNTI